MSTSIEQRVVQMRFDNKQFESGIAQSMDTLDKFNKSLNFSGAAKSFNEISRAAESVSLAPLMAQADQTGSKFDAMSVVVITAIQRMTNAAISAGTSMAKSLSVDQVMAGWRKYESRTAAVQTLVNATGRSVQDIEGYMSKLMRYSDETSYGFDDMATSLGTMVSAGGDIEKLIPLLEGFGNAVSFVGKGAAEYKRAVIQLSQGYGRNALMLEDWKSIEQTLGGAKQLKEVFIDVGEELGKIRKGELDIGTFNESLRKKWLDQSVMEEALGRFAEMTERAFEMVNSEEADNFADAYEILSQSFDDYRIRAAKAAQEAKTFGEAIEATRDAVSSGWMETFNIIFGNYEEAVKLWTGLTDVLLDVFASGAEARNEMLLAWKDADGREALIEALSAAYNNLAKVLGAVRSAFLDIFPPITGDRLAQLTKGLRDFIRSLELSDAAVNTLRVAVKALLLPFKILYQVVRIGVAVMGLAIQTAFSLADALIALPSLIGSAYDPLRKIFGDERYARIGQALLTIVTKLGSGFSVLGSKVKEVFISFKNSINLHIPDSFRELADVLRPIAEWILDRIVDGFELLAKLDYSIIGKTAAAAFGLAVEGAQNLIHILKDAKNSIVDFFAQFPNPIEMLKALAAKIYGVGMAIVNFFKNLDLAPLINALVERFGPFGEIIGRVMQAVVDFADKLTPAKILVLSFGVAVVAMFFNISAAIRTFAGVAKAATKVLDGLGGLLSALRDKIRGNRFLQIAVAISVLAGALILLSQVNPDGLKAATKSLIELMIVFGLVVGALAAMEKFLLKTPELIKGMRDIGLAMLEMAGAVALVAAALYIMSSANQGRIIGSVIALGAIMVVLIDTMVLMRLAGGSSKDSITDSLYLLSWAVAVKILVGTLNDMGKISLASCVGNLITLVLIMGLLATVTRSYDKIITMGNFKGYTRSKNSSGFSMLAMVGSLWLLAKAIEKIADIPSGKLVTGLKNFIPVIMALGLLSKLVGDGKGAMKGGIGLLSMTSGLLVMYFAIKMLGSLDKTVLTRGTNAVTSIMLVYGAMLAITKIGKDKEAAKMQGSFISFASSILILGVAIDYLGSLEITRIVKGTAVVGALMLLMGFLIRSTKDTEKANKSIIAMTVCIGILVSAVALFTLLEPEELITSVAAMGIALLSLAAVFKSLDEIKWKTVGTHVVLLTAILGELVIAFLLLKGLYGDKMLKQAASLSLVILAIAAVFKTLSTIKFDEEKTNALKWIGAFGALTFVLIEAGVALAALNMLPLKDGLIEKTVSFALLIVALTGITAALSKLKMDLDKVTTGITAIAMVTTASLVLLGFLGILAEVGAAKLIEQGVGTLNSLYTVIPALGVLTALTFALSLLGSVGPELMEYAAIGAAAIDIVAVILLSLFAAIGSIEGLTDGEFGRVIHSCVSIFESVGEMFGALIGGFGKGVVDPIIDILPSFGASLSEFGENISGFLAAMGDIDVDKVSAVTNLGLMVTALTSTQLLNQIIPFVDKNPLGTFAKKLVEIAPDLVEFSNEIADINEAKITAVAEVMAGFAEVTSSIPTSGGLMGMILGNQDVEAFGNGMKTFAEGFKTYAEIIDTATLSKETVDKTKYATDALVDLANKVPASGGMLQEFFGSQNIGTFGAQMVDFAGWLVKFFAILSGKDSRYPAVDIDDNLAKKAGAAGKAIAEVANKVPTAGGKLQEWFGSQNLETFGLQLKTFAIGLAEFFKILNGDDPDVGSVNLDGDIVTIAKNAGDAFAGIVSKLPNTGGIWEAFVGSVDLGDFGDDISNFGAGLSEFFAYFKSKPITGQDVTTAENAGLAFVNLANSLNPNKGFFTAFESVDLSEFGNDVANFGNGLYNFYENIEGIVWADVDSAMTFMERLVGVAGHISEISVFSENFSRVLSTLAGDSLRSFTEAFADGEDKIKEVVVSTINNAIDSADDEIRENGLKCAFVVEAMVTSITANEFKMNEAALSISNHFADKVSGQELKYKEAGKSVVDGIVAGINGNNGVAESAANQLANVILVMMRTSLGIIATPYSTKFEEIGRQCIRGFIIGFTSEAAGVGTDIGGVANGIADLFGGTLGVESPSKVFKEIGMYTMLGFQQGIDGQTTATTKSMVKMGEAILTSIQKFFGINSPSTLMRDEVGRYIVQGIAEGITSDMSAEDAATKKAQNIVNAFKSTFDQLSDQLQTQDLEFELWSTMNPYANANTVALKQNELLDAKLKIQAERVNAANAQYQATLKALGEGADQTVQAYNSYLQEKITLAALASQMNQAKQTNYAAFDAYTGYLNEWWDQLEQAGLTTDQIMENLEGRKDIAKALSGWDTSDAMRAPSGSVEGIMDAYLAQTTAGTDAVEVILKQSVPVAASYGYQGGQSYIGGMGEGLEEGGQEIQKTIKDVTSPKELVEYLKEKYGGSAMACIEGFIQEITNLSDEAADAVLAILGSDPYAALEKLLRINSTSKEYAELGAYTVEGFVLGIDETAGLATTAVADMAANTIAVMQPEPPKYEALGQQISAGLANGINAAAYMVQNAATNIASLALGTTMGILGIHSPSREYYEIGTMMDQGLANGILDSAGVITNAVADVLDKAQDTMDSNKLTISSVAKMESYTGGAGYHRVNEKTIWDEGRLLQWDANGNLIPVGARHAGTNQENSSWWIAPTAEIAQAIRSTSDTIAEQQAKANANQGLYQGTVDELKDAIKAVSENPGIAFTQNNYSPEPLSASKIYTNTQTALSKAAAAASPSGQSIKEYAAPPAYTPTVIQK